MLVGGFWGILRGVRGVFGGLVVVGLVDGDVRRVGVYVARGGCVRWAMG